MSLEASISSHSSADFGSFQFTLKVIPISPKNLKKYIKNETVGGPFISQLSNNFRGKESLNDANVKYPLEKPFFDKGGGGGLK